MVKIRILYTTLICTLLISCKSIQHDAKVDSDFKTPQGYRLVWNEEFNTGIKPNPNSWSYENGFVRNQELQWYQEENATVANGNLIITGKREKPVKLPYSAGNDDWLKKRETAQYTSSSIHTRDRFEFMYGIVEVRAKIDTASGMWPAIWTLGINRGWPSNGEIDMMEYYQIDGKPHILANAAWGESYRDVSWDSAKIPFSEFLEKDKDWANKFHIWKMDWTENYIKLYLDDELLNEIDLAKTQNPDGFNGFHQRHYLLLNLAIGSNGGDPSETEFPKEYHVDYVRVFQKNK